MALPNSYKINDGCYNCGSCFIKKEWDAGDEYHCCNGDNTARPLCGSVFMHEEFYKDDETLDDDDGDKLFRNNYDKWYTWSENRKVYAWGSCDKWNTRT